MVIVKLMMIKMGTSVVSSNQAGAMMVTDSVEVVDVFVHSRGSILKTHILRIGGSSKRLAHPQRRPQRSPSCSYSCAVTISRQIQFQSHSIRASAITRGRKEKRRFRR